MAACSRRAFLSLACPATLIAAPPKIKITGFRIHKATVRWRDLVFLEVLTDAGLVGIGEATLEGRAELAEAALRWLEPDMIGRDPWNVEEHWDRVYYKLSRWRNGPAVLSALSAVDIALWDLNGKRLGIPVWQLLGGKLRESSRVYYTHWGATLEANRTPEAFRDWTLQTKAAGWNAVKWTLAPGESEAVRTQQAIAECKAVRDAAGPAVDFCLEAAESFTVRSAIEFAKAVAPHRPLWIEEPTLRENPAGLGEVAAKSPVAVASGEGLFTRYEFRQLLDARGAAIIQPDIIHAGGITEIRKIASLAETYGVEIAPHQCSGPVAHVASLAAMSVCRNFLIQEWEGADDTTYQQLTNGTFPVQKNGKVTLPDTTGLGITVDFAAFTKRFPFQATRRKSLI